MQLLDGKVVLVTGAAQGLGADIARACSHAGAAVALTDVLDDAGRAFADALPGPTMYRRLDVTSETAWPEVIAEVEARLGPLTGLVNNAGVLLMEPLETTSLAAAARVLEVNTLGVFLGMRAAFAPMRRNGGGSIVNIASIDGVAAMNSVGMYTASKFAVRGLTRAAAIEHGRDNIRVNSVCPAMGNPMMVQPFLDRIDVQRYLASVPTPILPEPSTGEDAARMTRFLLSDESHGITGADHLVDAGWLAGRYFPGLPGF